MTFAGTVELWHDNVAWHVVALLPYCPTLQTHCMRSGSCMWQLHVTEQYFTVHAIGSKRGA